MDISPELRMSPREPELLATFFEDEVLGKSLCRFYRTVAENEDERVAKVQSAAGYVYDRVLLVAEGLRSEGDNLPLRSAIQMVKKEPVEEKVFFMAALENTFMELGVLYLLDTDLINPGCYLTKRDILKRIQFITYAHHGDRIRVSGGGFFIGDNPEKVLVPSIVSVDPTAADNKVICYDVSLTPSAYPRDHRERISQLNRALQSPAIHILKNSLTKEAYSRNKRDMADLLNSLSETTPGHLLVITDPIPRQVPGYDRTIQAGYRNFDATLVVALGLLGGRLENPKNWMEYLSEINHLARA